VAEGPCDLLAAALGRAPKLVAVDAAGPGPFLQDIVLEDGGSIRGRVVDAAGSPVAGTEVVALPEVVEPESSSPGAPESSEFSRRMAKLILPGDAAVRTGEDGRYEIAHLPGGAFLLVARAGGFEAAQAAGVRTGETAPDLVLGRFSAVRGTVVSAETGRPVPTFTVDVLDRKKLPGAGGDEGSRRRQIVDYRVASEGALRFHHPAGRFLYDGLRPSEYVVLVQAAGHVFARQDIALAPGEEAELSFALEAGGRLTGVVIDSETGLPIAGAPITCGRQGSRPESTIEPWYDREEVLSAEDGTFTIGGLRPGKYFVNASHPYYAPDWSAASQSIEVPAAEGSRVEIRMRPAGRLEGSVRGAPADEPGKKVQIQIVLTRVAPEAEEKPEQGRGFGGFEFLPVHLDPQGQYRADRVLPGRFKLEVKAQEVELGEQVHLGPSGGFVSHKPRGPERTLFTSEVEVEARRTTTLDIKLP
jgi:hypothetical protein